MVYRNKEGYPDPTAGEAIGTVTREEKRHNEEVTNLVNVIKQIISLAGQERSTGNGTCDIGRKESCRGKRSN